MAAAARPRGDGAHHLGLRRPADDAADDVVRTADVQRWRAKLAGQRLVGAMFDSPTYSGRPHPLSRVLVPEALVAAWLPFARSRALRLARQRRSTA